MRVFLSKFHWIIGGVLGALLLAGCSMVRLGYSQAPNLAYWWIDGHADLTGEQTPRVREAIDQWFAWHRRTQLPDYATLLARAQSELLQPTTPQAMCGWRDLAQRRLDVAVEQATPALAALIVTLAPEQLRHIERKLAKDGDELRADFAQADRAERAKAAFKRTLERYETLYGQLDEPQRARLALWLAQSSFDAERWLAERERRIRDLMQTLQQVSTAARTLEPAAATAQAQGAVRVLVERTLRSPRPDYRSHQERLALENCELAATLHNLTTPAQRQHARRKLKGWEEDLRLLVGSDIASAAGSAKPAP